MEGVASVAHAAIVKHDWGALQPLLATMTEDWHGRAHRSCQLIAPPGSSA